MLRCVMIGSFLLAAAACGQGQPTQLIIQVSADSAVAATLVQVRVAIHAGGEATAETRFDLTNGPRAPRNGEQRLPFSFGIAAGQHHEVELVVRGYASHDTNAQPLVERRVGVVFRARKTVELDVPLRATDRVCAAVDMSDALGRPNAANPLLRDCSDAGMSETAAPITDAGEPPDHDANTADGNIVDADAGPPSEDCTPSLGAEDCDPVARCGCQSASQHCQLIDDRGTCASTGTHLADEPCARNRDCASGLSCIAGACRNVCRTQADCPQTATQSVQCLRREEERFGFCAEPCAKPGAPRCREGLQCSPLRLAEIEGAFCVRVEDPCPLRDDGVCDEAGHGTGFCAAGSDANDCCTMPRPNGYCDLVTQCGCPADKACRKIGMLLDDLADTGCGDIGDLPVGSRCDVHAQCGRGALCSGSICKRTCDTTEAGRCPSGSCNLVTRVASDGPDTGVCWPTCEWDTSAPCLPGTICAQLATGNTCYAQPEQCHPTLLDNKVCDETTRLCAPGTDTNSDCKRTDP